MLYQSVKGIFSYALNIFYDITVLNKEQLPQQGATIVYADHPNYVADLMVLHTLNPRPSKALVAIISLDTLEMGYYLKALDSITVVRPQDVKKYLGEGRITKINEGIVQGKNTKFTSLAVGSTLILKNRTQLKIKQVFSNDKLQIQEQSITVEEEQQFLQKYATNNSNLFQDVWKALQKQQCITIFPEGRSKQSSKLCQIKAGISKMALGAITKYDKQVKLVPCALHYYQQYIFRSKLIVEYGQAYDVPEEIVKLYSSDRRKATGMLLEIVEKSMKSMVIEYDDHRQQRMLFLFRQLYTLDRQESTTLEEKIKLNRTLLQVYKSSHQSPKYIQSYKRLQNYSEFIKQKKISVRAEDATMSIFLPTLFIALMMIPGVLMWGFVALFMEVLSEAERRNEQQEAGCFKKFKCRQYVGSYKVFLGTILFPLNLMATCILLYPCLRNYGIEEHWLLLSAVLLLFSLFYAPFYSKCYDKLKKNWRTIRFFYLKFFNQQAYLYFLTERSALKQTVRSIVEQVGING